MWAEGTCDVAASAARGRELGMEDAHNRRVMRRNLPTLFWSQPALEATQRQMDGFSDQLPYKFHLKELASVGD